MHIINEQLWSHLPIPDYRGRFFVEVCYELLHVKTPPFHQSRLLNVISATEEVLVSIDDYYYDELNLRNLYNSIRELKACLKNDIVMKSVITDYQENINDIFNAIKDDDLKKIHETTLRKLKLLCKNILNLEHQYIELLTKDLIQVITTTDIDLSKTGKITNSIYDLTSLYITHLLSKNYAPSYLYNRMQMFTRKNNYRAKSFNEQVNHVFDKLNNRIDKYTVCFALKTANFETLDNYTTIKDLSLCETIEGTFEEKAVKKINSKNHYNAYALINVEATDYITASFQAKEKINLLLDTMNFHNLIHSKDINHICLVKINNQAIPFVKHVDMESLLSYVTTAYTKNHNNHHHIFQNFTSRLKEESNIRFNSSLHYLRLSKDTSSLDQKLLNIWISLESLFDKHESTIIGNILQWLPKIYATASINDRLIYILELLIEYKVQIPEEIRTEYNIDETLFSQNVTLEKFTNIFFNESAIEIIFESIENKEFLKFRLQATFLELKNSKKIIARVDKTIQDVDRQIKRIYVIRNKLTHQAFHGNIKGQIVNHLYEYIMICYHAIFSTLEKTNDSRQITIDDALLAYQMGSDNLYSKLKSLNEQEEHLDLEILSIKPVI